MMRVGLVQMSVGACKKSNVANAVKLIKHASEQGAKLVTLPECFNSPYGQRENISLKKWSENNYGSFVLEGYFIFVRLLRTCTFVFFISFFLPEILGFSKTALLIFFYF